MRESIQEILTFLPLSAILLNHKGEDINTIYSIDRKMESHILNLFLDIHPKSCL